MPHRDDPAKSEPRPDDIRQDRDDPLSGDPESLAPGQDFGHEPTMADSTTRTGDETYAPTSSDTARVGFEATPGSVSPGDRYQVVRLHARGGIGQVLLAIDSGLSREVALKEIQPALADDEPSRRRFLLEAEITGRLEHPGVVPVYSLGKSADDRPFYVMRFIRGDSLKEAIDAYHADKRGKSSVDSFRSLEFRQLLRRFVDVCNTIAYAHSRGVLHRDLKPSNVMLGPYGETLVVDWGLAKVVGRQDPATIGEATLRPHSGSGMSETQAGIAIGTPAYMSPEQAEGRIDSIGTASDIYSLGATLFTIMTGRPPFAESSLDRLLARVRTGDFPPPRSVEPGVPKALDAICRKAMALSSADRYASAGRLAQEIEHWLADEPVECYREPALTRLSRWGRRHKTAVAATGIFLTMATIMLAAGTIVLTRTNARIEEERRIADGQRVIAQTQRDLARENFDKAREAVNSYLNLVKDEPVLNRPGLESVRQKLLKSALPYYEDFIRKRGDDPSLRLELAEAYRLSGEITGLIDSRTQARERLEKAIRSYDEILAGDPGQKQASLGLGRALVSVAYFEVFDDNNEKAEKSTDRAIRHLENLVREPEATAETGWLLGRAYDLKSINLSLLGDLESALLISDKAVNRLEANLKTFPDDLPTKRILARSLNNRAASLLLIGRLDDSLKALGRSVEMLENLLAAEPEESSATVILARVMTNVARVRLSLGQFADAVQPTEQAMSLCRKLLAESPDMNQYIALFVDVADRRALVFAETGRIAEAREMIKICLDRERDLIDKGLLNDDLRETFADGWWTLALIEGRQGRFAESDQAFEKAENYFRDIVTTNVDQTYFAQRSAAREDRVRLRPMPAEPAALDARVSELKAIVAERETRFATGPDPDSRKTEVARGLVTLSDAMLTRDGPRFEPAMLHRALALVEEVAATRPNSLEIRRIQIEALCVLARHLAATGKPDEAADLIDRAIAQANKSADQDSAYLYDLALANLAGAELTPENKRERKADLSQKAISAIALAITRGFQDFPRLKFDPRMARIRDDPAFQALLK